MNEPRTTPDTVQPADAEQARTWRAGTDDERVRPGPPADDTGLRAFLRKLSMLFSLDPRSGGR